MYRRILSAVLIALLLLTVLPCTAFAAGENPQYHFDLYVDGKTESRWEPGDIVTFSVYLHRTDSDESFNMRGMQTEVSYDTTFFRLVEGSQFVAPGIVYQHVKGVGRYDEVYLNFLSLTGNTTWEAEKFVGSFKLEVISETGVSKITLEDSKVVQPDGTDVYDHVETEHTVIVTADCTVKFESNGGSAVQDQVVVYGEKIVKPADPTRNGYAFVGWYKDIHLQEQWNFDTDTIDGSMSLYAKWKEVEPEPTGTTGPTQPTKDPNNSQTGDDNLLMLRILPFILLLAAACIVLLLMSRKKRSY